VITLDLTGRIAMVTGATGGLGRRISADLAACGADVVLVARREGGELDDLAAELHERTGRAVHPRACDVSDSDAVRTLAAQLKAELPGPVDIIVNNAGVYADYANIVDVSDDVIDRTIDTNLKGTLYVMREFGRWLMDDDMPGAIVNIGSGAGRSGRRHHAHYCASKAGILGATRAAAIDLAACHITVNTITVGFVDVGRFDDGALARVKQDILPRILLKRAGDPGDISAMVCYLASEHANWITGTDIVIDGGESAGRIPAN
jgi:NAD(P)-dependent dehydrogenase (short-subunit alcohol dehydrogenase family)